MVSVAVREDVYIKVYMITKQMCVKHEAFIATEILLCVITTLKR